MCMHHVPHKLGSCKMHLLGGELILVVFIVEQLTLNDRDLSIATHHVFNSSIKCLFH